ncbi:hypothetical protein COOONC_01714 [Cooperia oncophora]
MSYDEMLQLRTEISKLTSDSLSKVVEVVRGRGEFSVATQRRLRNKRGTRKVADGKPEPAMSYDEMLQLRTEISKLTSDSLSKVVEVVRGRGEFSFENSRLFLAAVQEQEPQQTNDNELSETRKLRLRMRSPMKFFRLSNRTRAMIVTRKSLMLLAH